MRSTPAACAWRAPGASYAVIITKGSLPPRTLDARMAGTVCVRMGTTLLVRPAPVWLPAVLSTVMGPLASTPWRPRRIPGPAPGPANRAAPTPTIWPPCTGSTSRPRHGTPRSASRSSTRWRAGAPPAAASTPTSPWAEVQREPSGPGTGEQRRLGARGARRVGGGGCADRAGRGRRVATTGLAGAGGLRRCRKGHDRRHRRGGLVGREQLLAVDDLARLELLGRELDELVVEVGGRGAHELLPDLGRKGPARDVDAVHRAVTLLHRARNRIAHPHDRSQPRHVAGEPGVLVVLRRAGLARRVLADCVVGRGPTLRQHRLQGVRHLVGLLGSE